MTFIKTILFFIIGLILFIPGLILFAPAIILSVFFRLSLALVGLFLFTGLLFFSKLFTNDEEVWEAIVQAGDTFFESV